MSFHVDFSLFHKKKKKEKKNEKLFFPPFFFFFSLAFVSATMEEAPRFTSLCVPLRRERRRPEERRGPGGV